MEKTSSPSTQRKHRVEVPATLADGRAAAVKIRTFLTEQGLHEDDLFACELAVSEGCNNAVHHVSPAGKTRPIIVEVYCTDVLIDMYIIDHTPGFDFAGSVAVPERDIERGRGLFLIQSMVDEVRYIRGHAENVLHLRKKRVAGAV